MTYEARDHRLVHALCSEGMKLVADSTSKQAKHYKTSVLLERMPILYLPSGLGGEQMTSEDYNIYV